MSKNEIDGLCVPEQSAQEQLDDDIDLYIGVFFDGTNNNKYQVMIGKLFRWKEIYNKHKWTLKKHIKGWEITEYNQVSPNIITNYPRSYWEDGEGKGIFSRSEIEYLYFGYDDINNRNSSSRSCFIEEKSMLTLGGGDIHQLSSKPDEIKEQEKLIEIANRIANKKDGDGWIKDILNDKATDRSIKGAPAQNSTYTNVAILESLYRCGDKVNTSKEKHISIYIEGSGADMQIEASTNVSHTAGHGVVGLGKGTGPSGSVAKVRKAVIITNRLIEQYRPTHGGKRIVRVHFDICGFSRGATSARMFCYVINPNINASNMSYCGEGCITGNPSDMKLFTGSDKEFLSLKNKMGNLLLEQKEIRNLLIADTVSSIGVIFNGAVSSSITRGTANTIGGLSKGIELTVNRERKVDKGTDDINMWGKRPYHFNNVDDYGLWATKLAKKVIHICAMDEVRQNFALTDIDNSIKSNGIEVFIPGCHTDIGGGASIGMESEKIINVGTSRYLTHYHVHKQRELLDTESLSHVIRISEEALKTIGWLNDDSRSAGFWHKTITGRSNRKTDETHFSGNVANYVLYRHVTPGYSNVALNLFKEKANGEIFNDVPKSYSVPKALETFYEEIKKEMNGTGRHFFYPKEPEMYYNLRRQYLHFSFNEQLCALADNLLVNEPEYVNIGKGDSDVKTISRIIYTGAYHSNKNSEKRVHMFDYGDMLQVHYVTF